MVVTVAGLVATTVWAEGDALRSVTHVLGFPVVAIGDSPRAWIAIAQVDARGVIALGQVVMGLITFAQGGVGVIAGLGQGMVGLMVAGQLAFGMAAALGQVAIGRQSLGQVGWVPRDYLGELNAELTPLLSKRPFPGPLLPPATPRQVSQGSVSPRRRSMPDALRGRIAGRAVGSSTVASRMCTLHISADTLKVSPVNAADPVIIRGLGDAVLQLSWSEVPRAFGRLLGLLGQPKVTTWLHVELRRSRGVLMTLSAAVPAALVVDLPRLPKTGTVVSDATLFDVLGVASSLQIDVLLAQGMDDTTLDEPDLSDRVRVFNALQHALRPGIVVMYLFPWCLLLKAGLWLAGSSLGDWITVAYCLLVVYVFSTLAMVLLLYPSVGPPSRRFAPPADADPVSA